MLNINQPQPGLKDTEMTSEYYSYYYTRIQSKV